MQIKRFSKNDQGFVCANCSRPVSPLGVTSRNHCPYCLHSLHVDINPGDRMNPCGGLLKPIEIETSSKKGYVIVFECIKCKKKTKNKSASDDDFQSILKVMGEKQK